MALFTEHRIDDMIHVSDIYHTIAIDIVDGVINLFDCHLTSRRRNSSSAFGDSDYSITWGDGSN